MANSKMNYEFHQRLRYGVKSEEEQAKQAQRLRQHLLERKYSGIALKDKEAQRKNKAKGELENDK